MLLDDTPTELSFTAIDFETAGAHRASVCSVGLARVRAGVVVDRYSSLVVPPTGLDSFTSRNSQIHGIGPEHVRSAPDWDAVFSDVMAFAGDDVLVAHNASFDRSVLQQACTSVDLDWPENRWLDTLPVARGMLTLASYSLPFVAQALGLPPSEHHDAAEDAQQAAHIAVALAQRAGVASLDDLSGHVQMVASNQIAGRREPGDFSGLADRKPLAGEFVAFTGKLTTTTRVEAISLVEHLGGTGEKSVTKRTTMLVTGDLDPRTFRPGATLSGKLQKAQTLAQAGQPIEIVTEIDFLDLIDVSREQMEQATRAQRATGRSGWLPLYIIDQGRRLADSDHSYNRWIREALRHPDGRAGADDACVRCGGSIDPDLFWLFLERHVCSSDCGESLKRMAKRAWAREDVRRPHAPTYAESYWLR